MKLTISQTRQLLSNHWDNVRRRRDGYWFGQDYNRGGFGISRTPQVLARTDAEAAAYALECTVHAALRANRP